MTHNISKVGIDLIKTFEGCRLTAYKPLESETYFTIGYGHYGKDVKEGMKITQEQAEQMLVDDLKLYESFVNNPMLCSVTYELNQGQFDALVSFTYNCGSGNLRSLCENRTIDEIGYNMVLYNKAGGKTLPGLIARRNKEQELYFREDMKMNQELTERVKQLEEQVNKIQALMQMKVPAWAQFAVDEAVKRGLIDTPNNASFDFYRIITILYRAGIIHEK